ncbi:AI-2E family transporter [Spirulina subsalsa]|uniref:AI-2E family transporter n=1 Tax=Spirulina subsalsa TaxID=54311 RepID=UPI000308E812|nr:AI-2E family transporter [Spirulina subsalsa]
MKLGDWIGLLCLILSGVILWEFRQILLLLFTAIVLAIALNSLVRWIQHILRQRQIKLSRGKAVLIALTVVLIGATLFISLILPPFINQFQKLIPKVIEGLALLVTWVTDWLRDPPPWFPDVNVEPPKFSELSQQIGSLSQNLLENVLAFFSNSMAVLLQVLLILIFTIMFLANPPAYRNLLLLLFPSFYRRRANMILARCEVDLLGWMQGICFNSLFVAGLCAFGLSLLDVQYVLTHALLAGVFNFVPNIGPFASAVFPVSVALLDSPVKGVSVIVLYVIVQNLESYWFSPMIMHKQVSLLPAATLAAQLFFTTFLGFLGLVLALPLAVIAKVWIEEAYIKDVLDHWNSGPAFLVEAKGLDESGLLEEMVTPEAISPASDDSSAETSQSPESPEQGE